MPTEAALNYKVTTAARVKALLEIDSSDNTHDTTIENMIDTVGHRFENYLDRSMYQTSRTEEYTTRPRQDVIFLRHYPVASIASVKDAADWDFSGATAWNAADYHVDGSTGMLHLAKYPVAGPNMLQVVYDAGMSRNQAEFLTEYPNLVMAADLQTAEMFSRRDTMNSGSVSVNGSSVSYEAPLAMTPEVLELLAPYRRMRFGA